jgi:hypothetical protein
MSPLIITVMAALRDDHPRAIDRYIDYFGGGGGLSSRPADGPSQYPKSRWPGRAS